VLGITAHRLVECSTRPVLVVKQAPDGVYRQALVPIDFTPASDAAAFVAAALAPDIDVQVFHAFESTGEIVLREADVCESVIRDCRAREDAALLARMRRSMTRLGLDSRRLSFALGRGSPVKATLRQAHSVQADVLVATKQRRARIATSVLGNINGLLARARCDMLIVSGWLPGPRRVPAAAPVRPLPRGPGIGSVQPAYAHAVPGSSWMRTQVPVGALFTSPGGGVPGG
jgi:nucleotide-binding universal stress UspA family protein